MDIDAGAIVKLKKVVSNHNNLRTDEVIGRLVNKIELGGRIFIVARPLDPSMVMREIITTPVLKIEGDRYHTKNSVYEITLFKELG